MMSRETPLPQPADFRLTRTRERAKTHIPAAGSAAATASTPQFMTSEIPCDSIVAVIEGSPALVLIGKTMNATTIKMRTTGLVSTTARANRYRQPPSSKATRDARSGHGRDAAQ
jgi:hypothetical protein